ncbi:MAG: cphA, partial [Gemmatimonadetes bacterium]|nr:cphA [Gemmatimonadota bacterium]
VRRAWAAAGSRSDIVVERVPVGRRLRVLVVHGRVASVEPADAAGDAPAALHPRNAALCELAAGAVGLDVAAVDVSTPDAGVPFDENGGLVTAVHAAPELPADPARERAAADAVVGGLYPPGAATTIPVVAITGTNGKTTTTRLIAHLFRQTGRIVGFTTTDGVYLQEQLLVQGDLTGPFAANVILSHRETEVAVLETARGGILKSGLGFDACDVGVVMNVTADHLGLRGIDSVVQLAELKAVIPAAVRPGGHAVLNADDPLVYAMRERTPGTIALFSTQAAGESVHVEAHLAAGGIVARPEMVDGRERLVVRQGARRTDLGEVAEIPLTFGGLARFQVQNVLAASTAAWVQGVPDEQIVAGLRSFRPSSAVTPGRLNVVETTRGRVLLDYAHNAAAIAGLFEFVRAMPAGRRMALLSAPGDRRDEDLREIGRLAEGLDLVVMKEHPAYRRGRATGEIARIMADGLRATGTPESRIVTFDDEPEAVAHVMSLMQPGDVVIIIADDTSAVMRQLEPILASDTDAAS